MTSELEARIIMHFAEDIAGKLKETAIIANRERLRRAGSTGIEAQAWVIVPSTLKWSDNSSRFTRGCAISVARNRARIAGRGQQVRFFVGQPPPAARHRHRWRE